MDRLRAVCRHVRPPMCARLVSAPLSPPRIVFAGIFHETHSFIEVPTKLSDFDREVGEELLSHRGDASPLAGALEVAGRCGWEILPTIDLRATPSGLCEDEVLEHFWEHLRSGIEDAAKDGIDGIYLVLHGAMCSVSYPDTEEEIVRRLRLHPDVGTSTPICGVLDLHGNISEQLIMQTDGLVAYRCNPHTDAKDAASRGAELLDDILRRRRRPRCLYRSVPVTWPPTGVGTADHPMRKLEEMARSVEALSDSIAHCSVMGGFGYGDCPATGVSFHCATFGDDAEVRALETALEQLCEWAMSYRQLGKVVEPSLASLLPQVEAALTAPGRSGPVLLVEPSDNIGGGAPGDAVTVLRHLLDWDGEWRSSVVINDAAAVAALPCAIGERLTISLGGKGSSLSDPPLELELELLSRSDGEFDLENKNSHLASMVGIHVSMGPCAVVCCVARPSVRIVITSRPTPPFDLGQLRSQGITPEDEDIIGVKAAVAHRAAYDPIAAASFTIATPGPCVSDLTFMPYKHARRSLYPLVQNPHR